MKISKIFFIPVSRLINVRVFSAAYHIKKSHLKEKDLFLTICLFSWFPCKKSRWHKVEMWHCLFALVFFLRTHPLLSLNKGRSSRCRCPGLHQCSLTFPACSLRFGERVTMGSICLLCTFARLLLWQHVTRGALIIRLPLLASGHSSSLDNHVN